MSYIKEIRCNNCDYVEYRNNCLLSDSYYILLTFLLDVGLAIWGFLENYAIPSLMFIGVIWGHAIFAMYRNQQISYLPQKCSKCQGKTFIQISHVFEKFSTAPKVFFFHLQIILAWLVVFHKQNRLYATALLMLILISISWLTFIIFLGITILQRKIVATLLKHKIAALILKDSQQATATLTKLLATHHNSLVRRNAITTLEQIGLLPELRTIVDAFQSDTDPVVRSAAAEALSKIEAKAILPFLIEALKNKHPQVRLYTVGLLEDANWEEARIVLREHLAREEDPMVKERIEILLQKNWQTPLQVTAQPIIDTHPGFGRPSP